MIYKGSLHFDYLKMLYPDKLDKYSSLWDTFGAMYNDYAILIIIPAFKRLLIDKNNNEAITLVNRLKLVCHLIYLNFGILIIYIVIIILIFGKY